jgi:hypothetical protein
MSDRCAHTDVGPANRKRMRRSRQTSSESMGDAGPSHPSVPAIGGQLPTNIAATSLPANANAPQYLASQVKLNALEATTVPTRATAAGYPRQRKKSGAKAVLPKTGKKAGKKRQNSSSTPLHEEMRQLSIAPDKSHDDEVSELFGRMMTGC